MGHYDYDTSGPTRGEIERRRRAYETKQASKARENITDEQVREFLFELNECRGGSSLSCHGSSYCQEQQHAKDVWYDDETIESAESVVENGGAKSVYQVLDAPTEVIQLPQLCGDAGLTKNGIVGDVLTDKGHQVMMGDDFDRPELDWDEERAQEWHEHEWT